MLRKLLAAMQRVVQWVAGHWRLLRSRVGSRTAPDSAQTTAQSGSPPIETPATPRSVVTTQPAVAGGSAPAAPPIPAGPSIAPPRPVVAAPPAIPPSLTGLARDVACVLQKEPGLRARVVASRLRALGWNVDRRQVNQILYAHRSVFCQDSDWCWSLSPPPAVPRITAAPLPPALQALPPAEARPALPPVTRPVDPPARAEPTLVEPSSLDAADVCGFLMDELAICPDQTARELAVAARANGFEVRRTDINSVLYSERRTFRKSDDRVPTWRLIVNPGEPVPVPGDPSILATPRTLAVQPLPDSDTPSGVLVVAPASAPADGERRTVAAVLGTKLPIPLYRWQVDALAAWSNQSHRGIVEAVTGTGKTRVALAALQEALGLGGCVHVLVPTIDLQEQWCSEVAKYLPTVAIGRRGAGRSARFADHDLIVSVVNSARDYAIDRLPRHSLLVADECHRYGVSRNAQALQGAFERRLGLTATYAREDDGNLDYLDPYFGDTCYAIGYKRAKDDEVTAHFKVALIGVDFADDAERQRYTEAESAAGNARSWLVRNGWVAAEPYREFIAGVVAARAGRFLRLGTGRPNRAMSTAAEFLKKTNDKRRVLAGSRSKAVGVSRLLPAIERANRTLVFTESIETATEIASTLSEAETVTVAAVHSRLSRSERSIQMARFKAGSVQVVVAPRVLDEGVDVPEADLAIIAAASKTRRQMVQRMGRVLRRKADGRLARFAILYIKGTSEDPARGTHESFLEEVMEVADEPPMVFDATTELSEVIDYLNAFTPVEVQPPAR